MGHSIQLELPCFFVGNFNLHPQQRRRKRLTLGVSHQRQRAAATKTLVQQEVERAEIGQLESFHWAKTDSVEVLLHTVCGDLADKYRISIVAQRDQSHVGSVTLVARTCVGQFCQLHSHASSTSTWGL